MTYSYRSSNGALRERIWSSGKCCQRLDFVRNPPFPGRFAPRTLQPAITTSGWQGYA